MTTTIASLIERLNAPCERKEVERIAGCLAASPRRQKFWVDARGFVSTTAERGVIAVGTYTRHATVDAILDDYREALKDLRSRVAA